MRIDKSSISRQNLRNLSGYDREVLHRPETAHLPSVLDVGEMPQCIAYDPNWYSVAFATDKRIINIKKSVFGNSIKKVESYPYTDLISIKAGKRSLDLPLELETKKEKSIVISASKETRFAFAEFVEKKISEGIGQSVGRSDDIRNTQPSLDARVEIADYSTDVPRSAADPKVVKSEVIECTPNMLSESEHVLDIIQGEFNFVSGVILSTDRRLVFLAEGRVIGDWLEDVPNHEISSVEYGTSLSSGGIIIDTSDSSVIIDGVSKQRLRQFAEGLQARIPTPNMQDSTEQQSVSVHTEEDFDIELRKLAQLKNEGILTEEEFAAKKRQILGI